MKKNHMNSSQMAAHLGCSKGYVSQLLNGNFDHKLSKLVSLSLAIGKVPVLEYKDLSEVVSSSALDQTAKARQKEVLVQEEPMVLA